MRFQNQFWLTKTFDAVHLSDVEVQPGLWETLYVGTCDVCKAPTRFRVLVGPGCPGVPCCSDECWATLMVAEEENRPSSSLEERPLDMREVAGSVPASGTGMHLPTCAPCGEPAYDWHCDSACVAKGSVSPVTYEPETSGEAETHAVDGLEVAQAGYVVSPATTGS
jgi:hypothetical protein